MKNEISIEEMKKAIEHWFYSDLDIQFVLKQKKGKEKLLCCFESDAWWEHINIREPAGLVTIKSIRHKGNKRRFIGEEGSDIICERLKPYFYRSYTKEELINLVEILSEDYKFLDPETWK